MSPTKIPWAEETWSPVTGCTPVSEGCANCYARKRILPRIRPGVPPSEVRTHPEKLDQPLHWRKPRRVFVCPFGDLFHEDVSDEFIRDVFTYMSIPRRHQFLVLTKRAERMRALLADERFANRVFGRIPGGIGYGTSTWPLPNVWLGVSVEDQRTADERIPLLLETPAAVRFVSAEPLLGPLDLSHWLSPMPQLVEDVRQHPERRSTAVFRCLDWVIVGGESGPKARPMEIEWLEGIVRACKASGVPVYVKQDSGRYPDRQGRIPNAYWIREHPEASE